MSKHFLPVKNFLPFGSHIPEMIKADRPSVSLGTLLPSPVTSAFSTSPTPVAPSPQVFTIPKSADFSSGPLNAILSLGFSFLEAQLHCLLSHSVYKPHLLAIGLLSQKPSLSTLNIKVL